MIILLFSLLFAGTAAYFFLSWKIFRLTRQVGYLISFAIFFYWTLFGAWVFSIDQALGGNGRAIGLHYYHIFLRLFPVRLDVDYVWANFYYIIFLLFMQLGILFLVKKYPVNNRIEPRYYKISHDRLLLISLVSLVLSFALIYYQIRIAMDTGKSLYLLTRNEPNRFFTLHQIFNHISLLSLIIGFLSILGNNRDFMFVGKIKRYHYTAYVIMLILVELYLAVLGNKHDMLFSILFGIMFYFFGTRNQVSYPRLLIFFLILGVPMLFTDVIRGNSFLAFLQGNVEVSVPSEGDQKLDFFGKIGSMAFNNEAFYAHFSMYGVLAYKIPVSPGISFFYLVESFIPRMILPVRVPDVYAQYISHLHTAPNQGYTIHHITGYYLNFHVFGLFLGSGLTAFIMYIGYYLQSNYQKYKYLFVKIICIILPVSYIAFLPAMVRTGPEAYKSLIYEAILIPALVIFMGLIKKEKVA